jgi:hypothetical protein
MRLPPRRRRMAGVKVEGKGRGGRRLGGHGEGGAAERDRGGAKKKPRIFFATKRRKMTQKRALEMVALRNLSSGLCSLSSVSRPLRSDFMSYRASSWQNAGA